MFWQCQLCTRQGMYPVKSLECDGGDLTGSRCKWFSHFTTTTCIISCCSKTQNGLTFWYLPTKVVLECWLLNKCSRKSFCPCINYPPPLSIWPHLFRGAGHEKRRGEQLKWFLAFRLYIGSFLCAQLPGPVHTARLGRVFFVYLA